MLQLLGAPTPGILSHDQEVLDLLVFGKIKTKMVLLQVRMCQILISSCIPHIGGLRRVFLMREYTCNIYVFQIPD